MKHVLAFLSILWASAAVAASAPPAPQLPPNMFTHFWGIAETLHKIESKAFRTLSLGTVIEEGLKAMVNKIDAHSAFFSPKSYQNTVEMAAGQFPGIGVSIISKETDADSLLVVEAIRGGPADRGGIKSGDAIIKVDGVRLRGLTTDEVVAKLKGHINTTVMVTVIRDKKPLKFTLTRQLIPDRSAYAYHIAEHETVYIALKSFSDKTPEHMKTFLQHAEEKRCRCIILDMRKNPGGVIESAVKTASLLLPSQSPVVSTQNNARQTVARYETHGTPLYTGSIPLLVLIDNFTASAAEILTGCLQHHARTQNMPLFVLGMPSFGKGSVQEIIPLHNGCAIKLTTLLYALPSGECIQALGITPDIIVKPKTIPTHELKWVEDLYGKEVALANHITRAEVTGIADDQKNQKTPQEKSQRSLEEEFMKALQNDSVIHAALTLGRVWHLGRCTEPDAYTTHAGMLAFLKKNVITDHFTATAL
jgi:carboxyl-terminal processing protease